MKKVNIKNLKGFTLIEILIVIIILAVLAGLAIPMYQGTVEKARRAEAVATLSSVRQSELRYYAAHNQYIGTYANLDFNPTAADTSGQTVHFTYTLSSPSATTFTATATRNGTDGGDSTSTVTINQAGVVAGTGVFQ